MKFPYRLIKIVGDSMNPTYRDGQYKVATVNFTPQVGDVMVYPSPESGEIVIKRLTQYSPVLGLCFFEGDNPDRMKTRDSRDYGWVEEKYIIAKLIRP